MITTDPSITTNGVTNFGTIYRGSTDDGAFTLWAFGSTSAFDTALGIDDVFFADANHLPIAILKFQSLSLTGNPTIDLSNGGGTKLGLIGVDGITSGPPGGTLTFTGLDLLVLATVNGSINLTSDVSFQDLSELAMYARGASSNLTIDSTISNIGILELDAEGSIQLTNPGTMSVGEFDATAGNNLTLQVGSLLLDGKVRLNTLVLPGTTVTTGANLTLNATGDYTNSSATEFSLLQVTNQGHIVTGGNISVNIGGNLTATGLGSATEFPEPGDFEALVQNTNGQIDNGGNLNLTVTGNVQVNGLATYVQNYDETATPAGHIGTGGNIDIEIGGNLTANSYVDVFLNNRGGGMIDSGGNLTFNVGGALTIGADAGGIGVPGFSAEFIISNRYDDIGGNTTPSFIGSDVSLFVHAASIDMAGILYGSGISNRLGSVIDGNATATWDVPGNVMIQGTTPIPNSLSGASWFILNDVPLDYQFTPPSGGTIHGNATLTLTIGGDLTIAGDASTEILNQRDATSTVPSGGTIDSDATLNITAANFSVGGELDVDIRNRNNGVGSGTGGSIGGNAAINLNLSGDLAVTGSDPNSGGVPGDANVYIANENDVGGSGGFIGGDATIDVTAGDISTGASLFAQIFNSGGQIVGSASLDFGVVGGLTTQGDAVFQILNNDNGTSGGTIGSNATITVIASDLSSGGALNAGIFNSTGGTIGGNANINFNLTGNLTTQAGASFNISNQSGIFGTTGGGVGGSIGSDAMINVTGGNLTADSLFVNINNRNEGRSGPGGMIDSSANLTFNLSGNLTTQTDATFFILNGFVGTIPVGGSGGTIGQDAFLNLTANSLSIGGALLTTIGNERNAGNAGGIISGSAAINLAISGGISALDDSQLITNSGGTIGSDATITVSAASLTVTDTAAGAFLALIDNSNGGVIGGNATINMNVSGSATVTSDATFEILGSDGAAAAAININGGSYDAGGTFLAFIDGDGTITFNNASAHADVLKVGALGTNGMLRIGGGMLSADTTLELYASGSNGQLNFVSNVTLGGNSIKILAANSVTIFDNIVVTIGGFKPAEVYTNNANYTGFGGNGTTTGTFAGAGANDPLPLDQAPPFGPAPRAVRPRDIVPSGRTTGGTINVNNTAELLAMLDGAVVGPDGRITIPDSKSATSRRDANQTNINRLSRLEHQLAIQRMRDRGVTRVGGGKLAAAQ